MTSNESRVVQMRSVGQKKRAAGLSGKLLAHVLECDVCLATIADLRLETAECVLRCPAYRALVRAETKGHAEKSLRAGGR